VRRAYGVLNSSEWWTRRRQPSTSRLPRGIFYARRPNRLRAQRRPEQRRAAALRPAARPAVRGWLRRLAGWRKLRHLRCDLGPARRGPRHARGGGVRARRTSARRCRRPPHGLLAQLAAIGAGAIVLWLALFVALLAGKLPAGGSAYLAVAIVSVAPAFAGVGAVASQLAPTKRMATGLASGVLAIAFALRTAADTSSAGWLRWTTPLGWAEELRPFATRSRSSCCCPPRRPSYCSRPPRRWRSSATSAVACCPHGTAHLCACACSDRRRGAGASVRARRSSRQAGRGRGRSRSSWVLSPTLPPPT
jgi:hypothetical protein